MSTFYDLYETPDPSGEGKKKPLHARVHSKGTITAKEFQERVMKEQHMPHAMIVGIMQAISNALGDWLAEGYNVEFKVRVPSKVRELTEETGYHAEKIELLLRIRTTVAFCNEKIDIYVATGLTPGKQHLDEDEFVTVKAYDLDELISMILDGTIEDSKTVSAILAYKEKYVR